MTHVTTKQLAKALRITPVKVRRILRSIRNDNKYTRYAIPPATQQKVRAKVVAINRKPVKKAA